ncbi:oryzin precursor [Xylaria bambusicola]|uniref:oryzin precursor n=1 Tax=Xylaria bambusicola TaxID=326684 RepID=UPI0020082CCE|nr:oryzin precursor [Xylaria bambusicola]KAI0526000.1 oryzin precursor [Xylaria bambusicola]
MRLLSLLLATPLVLGAPVLETKGRAVPGKWIVVMKEDYDMDAVSRRKRGVNAELEVESLAMPQHTYSMGSFKAYALDASDNLINQVAKLQDVAYIEPDTMVETAATEFERNSPWGLARISSRTPNATTYVYDDSAGEGTYTYIIDSGIFTDHPEFEGRASWGPSFVSGDENPTVDENGHGTHVAGIAGSKTYGVAKKTNLIAVKVLNAGGSGPISQVIAGIQWVVDDAKSKNRINKSVANISLGVIAIGNSTVSLAAGAAVEEGLFIAAAAGNSQTPVEFYAPAQYPTLCSIGASAPDDAKATFSNYGNGIDLFAPGVDVISTYNDGSTHVLSGTSMSAPHIAGLGAYLLTLEGDRDPIALCQRIQELATKDVVTNAMSPNNMVAFNGVDQASLYSRSKPVSLRG